METKRKEWLTVPEAAEMMGIGRVRAYEIVREGLIPSFKLSARRTRLNAADVDAYIRDHRHWGQRPPRSRSRA